MTPWPSQDSRRRLGSGAQAPARRLAVRSRCRRLRSGVRTGVGGGARGEVGPGAGSTSCAPAARCAAALHAARLLASLERVGADGRAALERELSRRLDTMVPLILAEVLRRARLTDMVLTYVNLDTIVAEVDLDAAAARLSVDDVARRLDIEQCSTGWTSTVWPGGWTSRRFWTGDLTAIVLERVDLDALVKVVLDRVDIDGVARRLDVEAVLDRLDLTAIVLERVDLDALVKVVLDRVDIDGVARRLDVEAVVERLDLTAIVLERVDLDALVKVVRTGWTSTGLRAAWTSRRFWTGWTSPPSCCSAWTSMRWSRRCSRGLTSPTSWDWPR